MGNQPSSGEAGTTKTQLRSFMRSTGVLGLSKAELDERCRPSGLYPSCKWEDKAIRKLIGDGKLAARLKGTENRSSPTDRECPICFLQYREINVTKCCSAHICTECYLQVRPQKAKSHACPFCNHQRMSVMVAQAMNAEAMLAREETEQRVIEAKIKERARTLENASDTSSDAGQGASGSETSSTTGFGSSLEQHERMASLKARSSSLSDHENAESLPEDVLRSSFAMTPEERRILEDEMRAQHSHPLSLRLEAEAEERRIQNELEYHRNNPNPLIDPRGRSRRNRGSHDSRRNWNQIVEAFERGGNGEVNSLDDLVVLEAAMILSMEEEARRRVAGSGVGSNTFDANRHATEGFPLVRSILSGRQHLSASDIEENDHDQSLPNNMHARRRGRTSLLSAAHGASSNDGDNALESPSDTAGLLMRGISEDDQLAMAIAASLQDQQESQSQQQSRSTAPDDGQDGAESESQSDSVVTGSEVSTANDSGRPDNLITQQASSVPTITVQTEDEPYEVRNNSAVAESCEGCSSERPGSNSADELVACDDNNPENEENSEAA